jgi:putative transposase
MHTSVSPYQRHRFPAEIISHYVWVWLYFRFALSFGDVEEILAMRGVVVTYETVREWCLKFGQLYANDLRRKSPVPATVGALTKFSQSLMAAPISFGVQ